MMARFRVRGRGICRHDLDYSRGLLAVSLIFVSIFMNLPPLAYGQAQPEGFLSIDCGGSVNNYTDDVTGLKWVTDVGSEYIMTGNSGTAGTVPQHLPNRLSLQQPRSFPDSRSKYCYELPTNASSSYLVRAGFYLESVQELTQFIVYIGATNVFTMTYSPADSPFDDPLNYVEAIFPVPGDVINVCLLPVTGWPFISSLELRPLNSSMYTYGGSERQYLVNFVRWNVGVPSNSPLIRFPDDVYDRFWYPLPAQNSSDVFGSDCLDMSSSPPPDMTIRAEVNCVPPKVMQDACVAFPDASDNSSWNTHWNLLVTRPMSLPQVGYVYVAVYAEDLRNSGGLGSMTVSIGLDSVLVVNVSNQASMAMTPNYILKYEEIAIIFMNTVASHGNSVLTVNAMEVYGQSNFNFSSTSPYDEVTITALKTSFNLTDWQGDPCTPVPYDWLSCKPLLDTFQPTSPGLQFFNTTYSISAINLSKLPIGGFTVLQNNPPYPPAAGLWFMSINKVSITESGVNASIFQFVINAFLNGSFLQELDVSSNAIESLPTGWPEYHYSWLTSLNLSQNLLAGPFQVNWSSLPSLQELNLSYNAISSFPVPLLNETQNLVVLDLSYNQLGGDISSLDPVVESNAVSLQELHVSNNRLTGSFPSALYFAAPDLTIVNFDGNSIEGTLNLSLWLNALEDGASSNSTPMIEKLFSFVNNSISSIYPSENAMESTFSRLKSNLTAFNTGILLGGNPYCKRAESEIQQYLCRPQAYPNGNTNEARDIMIISITVGVFALLLSVVTIATIWKLWKQVYALREIQQALVDQQVQPPFYQYNDLKSGTRDFHPDNKLGHGAFGEVYKGFLPDQACVAVKKLFNSQSLQVLNEFLNEVVLITGIKHRNLVQLKGCCIRDKQRILIYEYVEKGNLAQALWGSRANGILNWEQRFNICVGVARGLSYLHEELQPSIIHRDIKPENILLDRNLKAKIADFGLAKHILDESSHTLYTKLAGTLGYFAPEYATVGQLSDKADVYSYGIVVLEVVSGRKCIDHSLPSEQIFLKNWVLTMHKKGTLIEVLEAELRHSCTITDILTAIRATKIGLLCSQTDPERRPSISQVVTMLLGTMEISSEESEYRQTSQIEDFEVVRNYQMESRALKTSLDREEECTGTPLLAASSKSSFRNTESSKSTSISDSFRYLGFS